MAELRGCLEAAPGHVPARGTPAEAIRYVPARWSGLARYLDDGGGELDTNHVERVIRPVVLSRQNHLFAGSDGCGHHWTVICSRLETDKLNNIKPFEWLRGALQPQATDHPASRPNVLLPLNRPSAGPAQH